MPLDQVRRHLDDAVRLGVREYYFTGGEPFLNPDMEAILEATLEVGPATVLTNGLLLDPARCARLKKLEQASDYSLDLRVSLDGFTEQLCPRDMVVPSTPLPAPDSFLDEVAAPDTASERH